MEEVQAIDLAEDLRGSVTHLNAIISKVAIEDMHVPFLVNRQHLIMLYDAYLSTSLTADGLNTIAFALMASDHFEWDDDTLGEVLSDWSAPEINFPLNLETIKMHRTWLTGEAEPLQGQFKEPTRRNGRLISVREKVKSN